MGGKASRRKGDIGERELVHLLNGARIRARTLTARRVPLSGAMKATGFGGDLLVGEGCQNCDGIGSGEDVNGKWHCEDCDGTGTEPCTEEQWEVKRRAQGFRRIYEWLQDCQVLAFRGDRKEWIVCIRLDDLIE